MTAPLGDLKKGLGDLVGQTAKQVTNQTKQTVEATVEQVGIKHEAGATGQNDTHAQQRQQQSQEIVSGLYAPSEKRDVKKSVGLAAQLGLAHDESKKTASVGEQFGFGQQQNTASVIEQFGMTPNKNTAGLQDQLTPVAAKTPEEQKKLSELRQKLHQEEYYEPLVTRAKPVTESEQEEAMEKRETAADRMQRLDFEDEKKKKEKEQKMQRNQALEESKSPEKRMGTAG